MDNEAFRKLVADRTKSKSTKEIAREAVEDEFQRKGRGKRGRPDGYDSDSDGGNTTKRGRRQDQQSEQQPKKQNQQDLYRDRAKERREGTNHQDYATSMKLLHDFHQVTQEDARDTATLSKYLGGDEAHTHLVKGLDVALARKVKRDMGNAFAKKTLHTNISLVKPIQEKCTTTRFVKNASEAMGCLSTHTPSTSLGISMLSYLQSIYAGIQYPEDIVESPAGVALRRTSVIVSTLSDPRNVLKAWEIPQEVTEAAMMNKNDNGTQRRILVDRHLIYQIQGALDSKKHTATPQHMITASRTSKSFEQHAAESDDDDIFADAGNYIPPTKVLTAEASLFPKISVFDNLGITNPQPGTQLAQLPSQKKLPHPDSRNVIDRDIFGARQMKTPSKYGVGVASYQVDYGDELDTDFTGQDDIDDDDEGTHKKGKEIDATDASREYGRKQKKSKPPILDKY